MCRILRIRCWQISRRNHKGNSVGKYHHFKKKTQVISGQDRGSHTVFIQNTKTSQYAWNGAPIDDTDVMHRFSELGREFQFWINTELLEEPTLNPSNNESLLKYIRDVSTDSTFVSELLQILVDER